MIDRHTGERLTRLGQQLFSDLAARMGKRRLPWLAWVHDRVGISGVLTRCTCPGGESEKDLRAGERILPFAAFSRVWERKHRLAGMDPEGAAS